MDYSLADVFNFNQYGGQTFTNMPRFRVQKRVDKLYWLTGSAGEMIRHYWHDLPMKCIEKQMSRTSFFSRSVSLELYKAIENIVNHGFKVVCNKYKINNSGSKDIPQYFYQETRCRHHFGKGSLIEYFSNSLHLSPALDPEIRTLQLKTSECPDANLLVALLFTRYEPDLLKFPFQGNRSIAPETIRYARKLNENFPRRMTTDKIDAATFHLQPRDLHLEQLLATGRNNKVLPTDLPEACLKAIFDSAKIYKLFTSCFDEELYQYAAAFYDKNIFGRSRRLYAVIGVARVIEDVETSKRPHPPREDLTHFLEEEPAAKIVRKFKDFFTARIDIQLLPSRAGADDLQILSVSDDLSRISKLTTQEDGIGYAITSYNGQLTFVVKALVGGQIRLDLRGEDIRNPDKPDERIPYWIDYTKLTVNGQTVFDTLIPVWYEDFCRYDITNIKAGTAIEMQVEWLPHRSDT